MPVVDFLATEKVTAQQRLAALATAANKLQRDFGRWQTPWGEINRYQRLTGDMVQPFDDAQASLPVPYASGNWGALAAYGQSSKSATRRIYGERGNSFVAAVEFGPRIRAKSILAGARAATRSRRTSRTRRPCMRAVNSRTCCFIPRTWPGTWSAGTGRGSEVCGVSDYALAG